LFLQVCAIRDEDGLLKFRNLLQLAKCVFVLPHGNADPERRFSINKRIIEIHGSSLGPDTIEAIRLVKDYLLIIGGVEKVTISKELLKSCASAYSKYNFYLEEKKKKVDQMKEREREESEKSSAKEEINGMERDREMIMKGIEVAEKSLKEGHSDLEQSLKCKSLNRESLNIAQSKISMGMKRKTELSTELAKLVKAIKKKKEDRG